MTIRDRIRELANERGMSLPALESILGFGNGTIVKWDRASPNTDKLAKVANYFHVSLDYLYSGLYECKVTSLANGIHIVNSNFEHDIRIKIAEMEEDGGRVVYSAPGTAVVVAEDSDATDQNIAEVIASVKSKNATFVNGNQELTEYLELLKTRPEMRMLFQISKDATKEDVEAAVRIIEALRNK